MTVLEPLKDVQLSEGQDAHFQCRLSRASGQEARWALGGVPLQSNEMNDITVEQGTLHLLTLHKVGFWDLSSASVGSESTREDPPPGWWAGEVTSPYHGVWEDGSAPFDQDEVQGQASTSCLLR